MKRNLIIILLLICILPSAGVHAQRNNQAARIAYLVDIIDSLDLVITQEQVKSHRLDSLLKSERDANDSLETRVHELEGTRKQLESNVDAFQGENLKLNQSNRILIIFNSFVAILLIVTLVFYLRKMNRKTGQGTQVKQSVASNPAASVHANFEDKLEQLERLGHLREKGFLSDEEFANEKNRVLGK